MQILYLFLPFSFSCSLLTSFLPSPTPDVLPIYCNTPSFPFLVSLHFFFYIRGSNFNYFLKMNQIQVGILNRDKSPIGNTVTLSGPLTPGQWIPFSVTISTLLPFPTLSSLPPPYSPCLPLYFFFIGYRKAKRELEKKKRARNRVAEKNF